MIQLELKKAIYEQLVKITRRNAPNEACAFLFDKNTLVIELFPTSRSPAHFDAIDPELVQGLIDEYGYPSALFHSHPGGNRPSSRDEAHMNATMKIWNCIWLIMSNTMKLKAYIMCPMDTYDFGRLVYRHNEVEIVG